MSGLRLSTGFVFVCFLTVASLRPSEDEGNGALNEHGEAPVAPLEVAPLPSSSLAEASEAAGGKLHHYLHEETRGNLSNRTWTLTGDDNIDERPRDEKNKDAPTEVKVGFVFRSFFGMKLNEGSYSADVVLTFRWRDERIKALVTEGTTLTLSDSAAKAKIWMPEMGVSNRDINSVEVLSTAVMLNKDTGEVTKVQRILGVFKNQFIVKDFPFDTQVLQILVASTKYMADDVVVKAFGQDEPTGSKIKDEAFSGKDVKLESFQADAFEEPMIGQLMKSRGRLQINVGRSPSKFLTSIVSPCSSLIIMSYMVFWFPLMTPFVMPRLATSAISYMALMQVSGKYDSMIAGAGASWGDTYLQAFSTLLFITVVINVAMETISHQFGQPQFGSKMNDEMKALYPAIVVICLLICTIVGFGGSIAALVIGAAYLHHCYKQLNDMDALPEWMRSVKQEVVAGEAAEDKNVEDEKEENEAPVEEPEKSS